MNNYFSHDSNARNSDKLIPVRIKYGAEGYGIYFMILERLREEPGYMSIKDYNMIAFDLRVDAGKVKSIVEDYGLFAFTENGECFYSVGFLKRMELKDEKSEKAKEAAKRRWENKKKMQTHAKTDANACEFDADALQTHGKTDASKGKKSKEKEEISPEGDPKNFFPSNGYSRDDVPIPLSECRTILCSDLPWIETICMNNYILPEKHKEKLDEFFRKLQNEKVTYKSVKDAIQHYSNWLKNELNREQRYGHKVKPGNDETERKRRIVEKFQSSGGSDEAGKGPDISGDVW